MNTRMILILTLWFLFSVNATVTISEAATVFVGSRIITIDQGQRTITFKTKEGQTWTLPVTDPSLLNRQPIAKDDQVVIEIDLNDRITKVVKLSDMPAAPRVETEDR
jgi:hypothetical protein